MCLKLLGCLQLKTTEVQVPGTPGPTGPSGSLIYSGNGVPSSGLGSDIDYYWELDASPINVYSKASGSWVVIGTLPVGPVGPPGSPGSPGAAGLDGTAILLSTDGMNRTTSGWGTILPFGPSIGAGKFPNLGDKAVFDCGLVNFYFDTGLSASSVVAQYRLTINSNSVTELQSPVVMQPKLSASRNETATARMVVTLRKKSISLAQVSVQFLDNKGENVYGYNCSDVAVDMNVGFAFNLEGNLPGISGASYVGCSDLTVTRIKQ
jgi:hypothetical protein